MSENRGDIAIWPSRVREHSRIGIGESVKPVPAIKPEGGGCPIRKKNTGNIAEGRKSSNNTFPDRSVKMVRVTKVLSFRPPIEAAKPANPQSIGVRVDFGEEFGEKGGILGRDRDAPRPPLALGVHTSTQATLHWPLAQ